MKLRGWSAISKRAGKRVLISEKLRRHSKEKRLRPTPVEKYWKLRGRQPRCEDKVSKAAEVKKEVGGRGRLGSKIGSSYLIINA